MILKEGIFREPDLSDRPYKLAVEKLMALDPGVLFKAWTLEFGHWFAAPDSVLTEGKVNTLFFFETEFRSDAHAEIRRYPHYGRFLKLIPAELVKLTWVTGADGTQGAETIVTVEFIPKSSGTLLKLTHSGFPDEESKDKHKVAWPMVLAQLEERYTAK